MMVAPFPSALGRSKTGKRWLATGINPWSILSSISTALISGNVHIHATQRRTGCRDLSFTRMQHGTGEEVASAVSVSS